MQTSYKHVPQVEPLTAVTTRIAESGAVADGGGGQTLHNSSRHFPFGGQYLQGASGAGIMVI